MASADYKRGYAKGYTTRSAHWPLHQPPLPPEPITREVFDAAMQLRDEVDGFLATIDPEDPLQSKLGPRVDELDAALTKVSEWLRTPTNAD